MSFSIRLPIKPVKQLADYFRGRELALSLLLIIVMIMGCIFWLPSGTVNLREQEAIFPLVGIVLLLAGFIFFEASKVVGLAITFIVIHVLCVFTPDSYVFLLTTSLFGFLYYAIVTHYEKINKHRVLLYNLVCIFALFNVLWLILQANHIFLFFYPKFSSQLETGFFSNRNEVSVFLAASLPLFFKGKRHLGIPVVILGLYLSKTTTGIIAASIVLSCYALYLMNKEGIKWRYVLPVVSVLIIFIVFMFYTKQSSVGIRVTGFIKTLELIQEKPLAGWGLRQTQYILPLYLNADRMHPGYLNQAFNQIYYQDDFKRTYVEKHTANPQFGNLIHNYVHNDYLQAWLEMGAISFFLFVVIFAHFRAFMKTKSRDWLAFAVLAVLLITANSFFTFQIGRFLFMSGLFAGMIQGAYKYENRNKGQ